jgi:hypothetical protein
MESDETKTHTQCTVLPFGDSMSAFSSLGFIRQQAGCSIRMLIEEPCEAVRGDLSFVPANSIKGWMNMNFFWCQDDSVRHETVQFPENVGIISTPRNPPKRSPSRN